MRTVEMPAPTAASVNATSTASQAINKRADSRLNTPERATMANKLRVRATEKAVTTSILKSIILIKISILHLLCYNDNHRFSLFSIDRLCQVLIGRCFILECWRAHSRYERSIRNRVG